MTNAPKKTLTGSELKLIFGRHLTGHVLRQSLTTPAAPAPVKILAPTPA